MTPRDDQRLLRAMEDVLQPLRDNPQSTERIQVCKIPNIATRVHALQHSLTKVLIEQRQQFEQWEERRRNEARERDRLCEEETRRVHSVATLQNRKTMGKGSVASLTIRRTPERMPPRETGKQQHRQPPLLPTVRRHSKGRQTKLRYEPLKRKTGNDDESREENEEDSSGDSEESESGNEGEESEDDSDAAEDSNEEEQSEEDPNEEEESEEDSDAEDDSDEEEEEEDDSEEDDDNSK